MHPILFTHFPVPVLQPVFQPLEVTLDGRRPEILPHPARQQSHHPVHPVPQAERVECLDQRVVDGGDDPAELLVGDEGVQDFRVQIGERRGQIALDHPVAADADDPSRLVLLRSDRYVRVEVWEARMGGSPGQFLRDVGLADCARVRRDRRDRGIRPQ